MTKFGMVTQVG